MLKVFKGKFVGTEREKVGLGFVFNIKVVLVLGYWNNNNS